MAACLAILLLSAFAAPATAVTLTAVVNGTAAHDSNLFLLSGTARDQYPHKGADNIYGVQGTINAQTGDSVRGLTASAFVEHDSFQHNSQLNNTSFGGSLTGQLNAARGSVETDVNFSRRLVPFSDVRTQSRAMQTYFNGSATATHAVLGDFRAIGGVDYGLSEINNSALALNDYRRYGVRGGFGYYSPAGNVLGLEGHYTHSSGDNNLTVFVGTTPLLYQAKYSEISGELHLLYAPSVLLSFDGRIGYAHHSDHSNLAGSFSGVVGSAKLTWNPRTTIHVTVTGNRDFQSSTGVYSNGVRSTRFAASAGIDLVRNISFTLQAGRDSQTFRFTPQAATLLGARSEHILNGDARLAWNGSRFVVSAEGSIARRTASLADFDYVDRRFTISAGVKLGSARRTS